MLLRSMISLSLLITMVTVGPWNGMAAAAPSTAGDIRVMTWNVKTRDVTSGRPDNWARVIGNQEPDVVALQEICSNEAQELRDLLEERYDLDYEVVVAPVRSGVAESTGIPYPGCEEFSFPSFDDPSPLNVSGYGQALLSRLPVHSSQRVLYPQEGDEEQRGYQRVVVHVAEDDADITILNTHLGLSGQEDQVNLLAEAAGQEPATLVVGDFNLTNGDGLLNAFTEQGLFEVDPEGQYPTFPNDGPSESASKIDFIYFNLVLQPIGPVESYTTPSSDHRPLLTNFELLTPTSA